jgi:hypothetical protein
MATFSRCCYMFLRESISGCRQKFFHLTPAVSDYHTSSSRPSLQLGSHIQSCPYDFALAAVNLKKPIPFQKLSWGCKLHREGRANWVRGCFLYWSWMLAVWLVFREKRKKGRTVLGYFALPFHCCSPCFFAVGATISKVK